MKQLVKMNDFDGPAVFVYEHLANHQALLFALELGEPDNIEEGTIPNARLRLILIEGLPDILTPGTFIGAPVLHRILDETQAVGLGRVNFFEADMSVSVEEFLQNLEDLKNIPALDMDSKPPENATSVLDTLD